MSSGPEVGAIHHVELWVPDLARATLEWGWLLAELGYQPYQEWSAGRSWRLGSSYLVVEQSSSMTGAHHDRYRPGLNHLAFHAGDPAMVDAIVAGSGEHGWTLMFADQHPHAGGRDSYAGYLVNTDGYEVELVALESL